MGLDFTVFKGSADGTIVKGTTHKESPVGSEVLIRVTHSGVCGTDVHYRGAGIVLGHEGIGIVQETGPEVTYIKVGDRVGWGYQHTWCGHCNICLKGWVGQCRNGTIYGNHDHDQGSFATHALWKESALFPIPDGISSADAAPMMCAGITVWTSLIEGGVKPNHSVGVVGIGGLGHLAIQFAAKMGCEVTAFSTTDAKKEEAMKLGATHFVATKGLTELTVPRKLDHLLVTTSNHPDWGMYLNVMEHQGTIYPQTVSTEPLVIPLFPFLLNNIRFLGSTNPPLGYYHHMLDFAVLHKIVPIIQEFPMTEEGITEAFAKLDKGQIRYRGVLTV